MAQCQNEECGHQFVDESKKALEPDGWKNPHTAYYICPDCHKRSFFTTSVTLLVLVFLCHSQGVVNTVTSKLISITPQLNRIEAETKELKSIVTALDNKIKLTADRPARFSTKRQRERDYRKELHKQDTVINRYLED